MRRYFRFLRGHFGAAAPRVAVRASLPWYWRLPLLAALLVSGYLLGYWQYGGGNAGLLREQIAHLEQENRLLNTQAIHVGRQQQVNNVAQSDLARDLATLQEENVRLKEDVVFYKSILEESTGVAVVKLHSFKVTRSDHAGAYRYRLLLIQSGKHDKNVQGRIQLTLVGMQDGKLVSHEVLGDKLSQFGDKVNFKYYQPLDGTFSVPPGISVQSLRATFFQSGSAAPKLTQVLSIN